ncbi:MAG: helix-turn-helix domain-containing protein [Caldilineaceae bacterium]
MSKLLTPSQAAERMSITVKTVYQYLSKGQLEGAFKDERGRWQIPESAVSELDALLLANAEAANDEPIESDSGQDEFAEPLSSEPAESSAAIPGPTRSEAAAAASMDEDLDNEAPVAPEPDTPAPPVQWTPEEWAAHRERERAAALAALYPPDEEEDLDEMAVSEEDADAQQAISESDLDEQYERGAVERDADMEGIYARIDTVDQQDVKPPSGQEEAHVSNDMADEAEVAAAIEQPELDQKDPSDELASTMSSADDSQVQTEIAPVPEPGEDVDVDADSDEYLKPDEYVMDFVPVAPEPQDTEVTGPVAVKIASDGIDASDDDLSDIDLAGVDLAKVAPKDKPQPDEETERSEDEDVVAVAAKTSKRSGMGCPVLIALAATLIVLLIAGVFIANQSLGLLKRNAEVVPEVATPMVVAPVDETNPAESEPAVEAEAPAAEAEAPLTEAAAPTAVIQPQAEGESLIILPSFTGADVELSTQLRDAIAAQASALGLTNLRAEAEPSVIAADQLAQAVDLGAQYQADMVMWGEDVGDGTVVNLLSLRSAGLPAAETGINDASSAESVQPLAPSAYASFGVEDATAESTFLAGVAVSESSMLSGDYERAANALQQAVDSLDPQSALPTGLDEALFRLGWIYQTQLGDLQRALDAYTQALQLNLDHMAALNNIGIVFDDLGDKQQAIFYYNQALPLLREADNVAAEVAILNRMGSLYNDIGDVQQALSFYNRALPLTMEAGDAANEAFIRRKIALIHKDLGELDIAQEEMAKVLAIGESIGLPSLEQDQRALEEIQALNAQQTPETPLFRQRNR